MHNAHGKTRTRQNQGVLEYVRKRGLNGCREDIPPVKRRTMCQWMRSRNTTVASNATWTARILNDGGVKKKSNRCERHKA